MTDEKHGAFFNGLDFISWIKNQNPWFVVYFPLVT